MKIGKNQLRVIIGSYLISLILTSRTSISLVLAQIAGQFPNMSSASVQFVFTLANGAGMIGSIIAGALSSKMSKKSILILLMIIASIGGILGYLGYTSIALLYVASLILGIGIGGADPISNALIAEGFEDDSRAKWMGFKSVFVSVGGIFTTLLAGIIAVKHWQNVYLTFLLAIPMLFVAIFLLPNGSIVEKNTQNKEKTTSGGRLLNPQIIKIYIVNLLIAISWVVYNSNVSFLLQGNTTQAGSTTMCFMAGMTVAGLFVVPTKKLFKENAVTLSVAICALSLWILTQSTGNIVLICIGAALLGIGYCMYFAHSMTILPNVATRGTLTKTITYFSVISTLGTLIHPYLITAPIDLFNGSVLLRFYVCAIIMSIAAIISIQKQKNTQTDIQQ